MDEVPATLLIRPQLLTIWSRAALLTLVGVLISTSSPGLASWVWWLAMVVAALCSIFLPAGTMPARLGRTAEVIVTALAASYASGAEGTAMPYLAAPIFTAGIFCGLAEVSWLLIIGVGTLAVSSITSGVIDQTHYLMQVMEWLVVSSAAGMLGTWIRSLARATPAPEPEYAQATRLLTQLRTIARQLPGTLDPGSIAERLLEELSAHFPTDRAAVFTTSGGGRLEVLAQRAPDRLAWETSVDADTAIGDAWASQQPQLSTRTLVRAIDTHRQVSALVLPLVTGVRTVGMVALETDKPHSYSARDVSNAAGLAAPTALRLETALLFDDVRSLATTQERQRLAREIHDGVAQELVMVGYGIDNAIASLSEEEPAAEQLHALRAEVTRVITELRLSLFELRSDVDRHGGLGSAIADYARTVGTSAGFRVHLSLDESTARLPAAIEAELLRIAQESITNARKHARAHNLWVNYEVDPPYARLEIADDGAGIDPDKRANTRGEKVGANYGLSIMAERAARIRGKLSISARAPHGTAIVVELGGGREIGTDAEHNSGPVVNQTDDPHGTVIEEREETVEDETNDA